MNFKRWITAASIAAAVTALCGCTHQPSASEQFQDDMKRKFAELQDPRCSIDKMREFAMEKLTDLSDEESDYLEQHNPAITSNYEQSEYAFTWYIKSAKGGIEVLSSPPPCEPLAVFRVNHVYYP
jgi:hypothetical protein